MIASHRTEFAVNTSILSDRFEQRCFFGLLCTLFFAPLLWAGPIAMYWWYTQVIIQLLVMATAASIFLGKTRSMMNLRHALPSIVLLLLFFFYVLIVQLGFKQSISPFQTAESLLKTICLTQMFVLTLILVNSRERLLLTMTLLVYSGAFQALYGIVMTITGVEHIWLIPKKNVGIVTGTFVNRNHLAGYLEMTLALGIGLLIAKLDTTPSRNWRQWLRGWAETLLSSKVRVRVCLILMVIALIMTRSRMGNTAFMISLAIVAVIGLLVFRRSSKPVALLFASILVFDIVILGAVVGIEQLQERLQQVTPTTIAFEHRTLVAEQTVDAIRDHPFVGSGLGTWYTDFPKYRDHRVIPYTRHAHNDFAQFTSELGFFGSGMLGLVVILSLTKALQNVVVLQSRTLKSLNLGVTMAIISIMIHSIADFNLQLFANALTYLVILALPFCSRGKKLAYKPSKA